MITVKVTYGVEKEFASKNRENIDLFMSDFKAMNATDLLWKTVKHLFTSQAMLMLKYSR
jgi:hypothetical protein